MSGLNIAFFGSSLVSAYWNGAATYYRGIIRALYERGHRVTFYEPNAYGRQQHRDIPDPSWAKVVVYPGHGESGVLRAVSDAAEADVIVKASGVGVFDELLELAVLEARQPGKLAIFWDVDAPATLDRLYSNPADPFRALIPRYDVILTYGGGPPVVNAYKDLGAKDCIPIYNALDPLTHHPVPREARFAADLGFLGNRLPDREARVEEFFLKAATILPQRRFILGGSGWDDKSMPANVHYAGHVYTKDHNAFNCSPLAVLNISRQSMANYGFSPATRVFEAAGAASCLITDDWIGIDAFLEPGKEVLVAKDGADVAELLQSLTPRNAEAIGQAAYRRVLAQHTYAQRAARVEEILTGRLQPQRAPAAVALPSALDNNEQTSNPMNIVVLGLSITSSWGNGHATTYRGLLRELARRGHKILFLERDRAWYAANRDLPHPPYITTELYFSVDDLKRHFSREIENADCVIVGSYVPDGVRVGEWVTRIAKGITAFYDIDTPVTMAKLQRTDFEYITPALIPRFRMYLSFTGGPTLRKLEQELHSPCARPLYCSIDHELYYPDLNPVPKFDLGYLGTYSEDRQPGLERFLCEPAQRIPAARMVVAGPQYPSSIDWPANVKRIEHLPPSQHRAFYNQQRFTLNITRADMRAAGYSPSIRLFEAAACGTPVISDDWEGLSDFFMPNSEILIARTAQDVVGYLTEVSEGEREQLGRRARARVQQEHTAAHRALELEQYLQEIYAHH